MVYPGGDRKNPLSSSSVLMTPDGLIRSTIALYSAAYTFQFASASSLGKPYAWAISPAILAFCGLFIVSLTLSAQPFGSLRFLYRTPRIKISAALGLTAV